MKITFIGLGKMGSAIAGRLLQAGHDLTVYNRTAAKMLPLIKLGAKEGASLSESVKKAEIVFTCLLDDQAELETTQTIAACMLPESLHIGLATILPDTAQAMYDIHKGYYISATVLGVPKVAEEGKLTSFCAGKESNVKKILNLLETFSEKIIHLGENIKAPNIMKICMNYSLISTLELISELYIFAEKSGLEKEFVVQGLHQIYGHPAFKRYIDKIAARDFDDVNFDVIGGNKDTHLFQEAFSKVGVVPRLGDLVRSRFISALSLGMDHRDWSSIYEVIRAESGMKN